VRTRGRPTLADAADINRALLDAARLTFLEQGYDKATIEAIAAFAGVSKPTFYARFNDKSALFAAVLEDRLSAWAARSPVEENLTGTLSERLTLFARTTLDFLAEPEMRMFGNFVLKEGERFPEVAQIFSRILLGHSFSLVVRQIDGAPEALHLTPENREIVAKKLIEMVSGWLTLRNLMRADTGPESRQLAAEECVDILLNGVLGR